MNCATGNDDSHVTLAARRLETRACSFNLVLNRDLVQVSPRLIDYVIAHELAHAVFPDHGAKWRTLMSRVMSDWRERKEALEQALL